MLLLRPATLVITALLRRNLSDDATVRVRKMAELQHFPVTLTLWWWRRWALIHLVAMSKRLRLILLRLLSQQRLPDQVAWALPSVPPRSGHHDPARGPASLRLRRPEPGALRASR